MALGLGGSTLKSFGIASLVREVVQCPEVGRPVGVAESSLEREEAGGHLIDLPQVNERAEGSGKDGYHHGAELRESEERLWGVEFCPAVGAQTVVFQQVEEVDRRAVEVDVLEIQ